MSGFLDKSENCMSIESPPVIEHALKSVNFPKSTVNFIVCNANSLVGDKINALAPTFIFQKY